MPELSANASPPSLLDGYWSQDEFATQIGKEKRTVQRWAKMRLGPPITLCGKTPYYNIDSAKKWLAGREQDQVLEKTVKHRKRSKPPLQAPR